MPYFTALPDTLFVNGVDLCSLTGVVVGDLHGLHAPGTRRGSNDVVPGRQGQQGVPKPLDAYAFAIPVTLLPEDGSGVTGDTLSARRAQMLTNLRALTAGLVSATGLVPLKRRLATSGGYAETTADGEFVDGLAIQLLNAQTGQTELNFVNHDGCWYAEAVTVHAGSVTIGGDIPTRRISLDLPSDGTLTNVTLGVSVTVTTGTVLDVAGYTATAGLATMVTAGDDSWFVLAPGVNVITWSGDDAPDITYQGAYL